MEILSDVDSDSDSSSSSSSSSLLSTSGMDSIATTMRIGPEKVSAYDDDDVKLRCCYYDSFSDLLESIVDDRNVTTLSVEYIALSYAMMNSLVRVVEENTTINRINVINIFDCTRGMLEILLDAMKGNRHVERFDMSRNSVMYVNCDSMFRMLSENKTILELSMSRCKLGRRIIEAVSRGMMLNKTIKKWSVEESSFGNDCADVFDLMAMVLEKNSSLEDARIGCNQFCKNSMEALLESVSASSSLRRLSFDESYSVNRGDEINWKWMSGLVAKTLARNTSLEYLDITDVKTNNRFAEHLDDIVILQALVDHPRDRAFALEIVYRDKDKIQSWLQKAVEFPENGDNVMECIANDWDQKARRLVFMGGLHPKLGKGSIVHLLDIELVKKICAFQIC
jgi:Ran GTPase-activating protein (RanGAP) involved in mRNA processing and transport